MADHQIPVGRAVLWILLSTLIISGTAFMGWLYFLHVRELRIHDDQYRIVAIVQSTPQADQLKTVYLAELLGLSLDRPVNLYQFNTKEGVNTLLAHPLIKQVKIKKILPGTLYIHYQIRTPIAYVGEYTNTVIDEEGYLFPFRPFFTPKRLPILFLGLDKQECKWGSCLKENSLFNQAKTVLQQFEDLNQTHYWIKQIDLAQAQADSYGQRQIVVALEECNASDAKSEILLRLSGDNSGQDLANFQTLQMAKDSPLLGRKPTVVDLRIPHLAFIKQ